MPSRQITAERLSLSQDVNAANGEVSLHGNKLLNCIAVMPGDNCFGVVLHSRWILALSNCASNATKARVFVTGEKPTSLELSLKEKTTRGEYVLFFTSKMSNVECPVLLGKTEPKLENRRFLIPVIPMQACDKGMKFLVDSFFVSSANECSVEERGQKDGQICLSLEQKRSDKICNRSAGLPVVVTPDDGGGPRLLGLVRYVTPSSRNVREKRGMQTSAVAALSLSQLDLQWIQRSRRSIGKAFFLHCLY